MSLESSKMTPHQPKICRPESPERYFSTTRPLFGRTKPLFSYPEAEFQVSEGPRWRPICTPLKIDGHVGPSRPLNVGICWRLTAPGDVGRICSTFWLCLTRRRVEGAVEKVGSRSEVGSRCAHTLRYRHLDCGTHKVSFS